jgi:uncharacterized SAM-binding protein YcdF (DUF218 family)
MSPIKRFCYWVIAIFLVALVAGVLFSKSLLTVETDVKRAQIIVVLGGGGEDRPTRALELLRKGVAPRLLLSGAGEDPSLRAKLREEKIPDARIVLEAKSASTKENAEFSAEILRTQKITNAIIVTSWYHSRRALACFHKAAPEIHFQSAPTKPGVTSLNLPTARDAGFATIEYLKMIWCSARWRIFPWDA